MNNPMIVGYGSGLCGPTTPACGFGMDQPFAAPRWPFQVISRGLDTVAICPAQRDPSGATTSDGVSLPDKGSEKANAVRFVECWNACSGVPSERLSPGLLADLIGTMQAGLEEARRRDELMGEIEEAIQKLFRTLDALDIHDDPRKTYRLGHPVLGPLRAVLAKLEERP